MAVTAEESNEGKVRILLVDDDPVVRETLLRGLRNHGFQAEAAEDGLEALRRLQHGGFNVVVTDLQMPRLDGLALLREIRRRGYAQAVVVQTTLLDASIESVLRRAGASGVLMKGGPPGELVRSVEEACLASKRPRTPCA